MKISARVRIFGWGAAALAAALLLTSLPVFWAPVSRAAWAGEADQAAGDEDLRLGVVDFDSLLRAHRDFERLSQLDEQVSILEQELAFLPLGDQRRVVNQSQKRMQAEVERARREVEAEYERINAEMQGLSASMKAQFEKEGQSLQAHYRSVLEERTRHLRPAPVELQGDTKARMEAFLADLSAVRQQRLMARRLELEKQMQSRMEAERARVESELAAYEDQIMRQNQERKLNLQLQMQTAMDAEKEADIQEQIAAIGHDEQALKDARRGELHQQLEAAGNREQAELVAQLQAYEASLNSEVQQKAAAERNRLAGLPSQAAPMAPDVQNQIEEVRATLAAEMESRKQRMQETMQARSQEARERLKSKQAQVEKRLQALQGQLKELVEKSADQVSEDTQRKMDEVKARVAALKAQRKGLYDQMVADLSDKVGEVARKHEVPSVIGRFVVNLGCTDLTDLAMVAVKQAVR